MIATLPLPSEVKNDFQVEARQRGLDADAYTRFALDALAEAFATNPPEDEHQILLLMSRIENELPRAWKDADENTRLKYALWLFAVWVILKPERWLGLHEVVSPPVVETSGHHFSLRELKAMPRAQREAIMQAQAARAAPLYAADLALPQAERELTAFGVLDDYDGLLEQEDDVAEVR